jgi:hypothetical protein
MTSTEPIESEEQDSSDVQELYITQKLDHFSSKTSLTFQQRYFYTTRYTHVSNPVENENNLRGSTVQNKDSSVPTYSFICMGGEGPSLDKSVLLNSPHCSGDMLALAKILSTERNANVHVFAIEHRYYGKSYPSFPDGSSPVSNDNLVYLSSRQALADLAHFITYVKEEYNLSDHVPFITFGGSYPGVLAASARLKYPHLVHAAVSSSAPLQVQLDFYGYKDWVAKDLANEKVGGSQECLNVIQEGHIAIAEILQPGPTDGKEMIKDMFNLCSIDDLNDPKSIRAFLGDGVVDIDVQENDPSCDEGLCNISKICDFLTDESKSSSDPIEALAKLSRYQTKDSCKDISWEGMIEFLSSDKSMVDGTRSWLYQTCTEVGFYQTCHTNSSCPFGRGFHDLDADLEICQRAFGIEPNEVADNVQATLEYYGGWNIQTNRVLSINGDVDPWSDLSYSNSGRKSDGLDSYWSVGASHHYWTHEVKATDGFTIMRTREYIYNWVMQQLDEFDSNQRDQTDILAIS